LASLITPVTYEPLGIALPADDPLFVNLIENFLGTLKGDGRLRALQNRWFKEQGWLSELP
ncbi:MAG TPA: transporter substrate-binding domain-containing protein, partial [Candidatus Binatia bacterium]